jgi:hypothetical protein
LLRLCREPFPAFGGRIGWWGGVHDKQVIVVNGGGRHATLRRRASLWPTQPRRKPPVAGKAGSRAVAGGLAGLAAAAATAAATGPGVSGALLICDV